jgi:hypothetical protein
VKIMPAAVGGKLMHVRHRNFQKNEKFVSFFFSLEIKFCSHGVVMMSAEDNPW